MKIIPQLWYKESYILETVSPGTSERRDPALYLMWKINTILNVKYKHMVRK